ncbi:hypothetical protein MLD59_17885 [Verrucomicrobiaceae bacterium E54]|nr:hypothetical protein [Verrucomicrobiaceae bacterium E54]
MQSTTSAVALDLSSRHVMLVSMLRRTRTTLAAALLAVTATAAESAPNFLIILADDLVDFTDLLPTLCELSGAPLPDEMTHGRSFAPQLLGKPGQPREWVHIQDKEQRHIRSRDFILDHRGQLRPVVELRRSPAPVTTPPDSDEEAAARRSLQAAFEKLGD